jgi:hypothetical protein
MDSTVDEPSDDEVANIYPPALAGRDVPARILKMELIPRFPKKKRR